MAQRQEINWPDFYVAVSGLYRRPVTLHQYIADIEAFSDDGAELWRVSPSMRLTELAMDDAAALWLVEHGRNGPAIPAILKDYMPEEPDPEGNDADRWHEANISDELHRRP